MEDGDCNIHLRNLSTHPARDEEDALNLLFQGDTNRMIAEVGAASLAARETKTNKQTNKINKKKKHNKKRNVTLLSVAQLCTFGCKNLVSFMNLGRKCASKNWQHDFVNISSILPAMN